MFLLIVYITSHSFNSSFCHLEMHCVSFFQLIFFLEFIDGKLQFMTTNPLKYIKIF